MRRPRWDDHRVHEFSGYTVVGIRKALDALQYSASVLPLLTPSTREALASGNMFKFHPGSTMDEVLVKLAETHGEDAAASLMEEATRNSLAGIVSPLARLFLTLKRNDPMALFERFGDLLRGTTRGIVATWSESSPTSGVMALRYPSPVAPVVVHAWRGALRHVLTFAGVEGESKAEPPSADGLTVHVAVRWVR